MSILNDYEFTIDDFEKTTIETGYNYLEYRTEIKSVSQLNNIIKFNLAYTIIDNCQPIQYEEADDESEEILNILTDNEVECPQIVGQSTFTILKDVLLKSYTYDGLDFTRDDVIEINYETTNIFIGNDFDKDDTVTAINLVGKEFIDEYLEYARETWEDDDTLDGESLFRFGCGFCGIKFSDEFLRKYENDLLKN